MTSWLTQLRAGPISGLLRFIALLLAICALASLYLWQASIVASLQDQVAEFEGRMVILDRENTALMLQVAWWNAPAYIEEEARRLGLREGQAPLRVPLPPVADEASSGGRQDADGHTTFIPSLLSGQALHPSSFILRQLALWQRLTGWLPAADGPAKTARTP
jgi:hypothetical protein